MRVPALVTAALIATMLAGCTSGTVSPSTGKPVPAARRGRADPALPLTRPADPFGLLADDGEHPGVAWCRRDGGKYLVQGLGHHR